MLGSAAFAQGTVAPATSLEHLSTTRLQRPALTGAVNSADDLPAFNWIAAASYPTSIARYGFAQNGESLYVVSGFSNGFPVTAVRRYDGGPNAWTSLSNIPVGTEAPVAVFYDKKIYVVDGYSSASQNRIRIYDVESDSWSAGPVRLGVSDSYGAAGGAYDGKIYIIGGGSSGSGTTVSIYDIAAESWSAGPIAPAPFLFGGYKQIGQYLYLAGGFSSSASANSNITMRLDMADNTWSTGPAFTPHRADFALAASGTKLFAIGGDINGGDFFTPSAQVDELETSGWPSGLWVVSPNNLPIPRQANSAGFFTTALSGGEIWSTGGFGPGSRYFADHLFRAAPSAPLLQAPVPLSVVSRETHGATGDFDVALPLTGLSGVECRTGGPTKDYQMVVEFALPVTITGTPQARITSGVATIVGGNSQGGPVIISGSKVVIPLTGVENAQELTVTLQSVSDNAGLGDVSISMRVLIGDTNGDSVVNSGDAVQVRSRSGQAITAANFRADVNADGAINSGDFFILRGRSGTAVP